MKASKKRLLVISLYCLLCILLASGISYAWISQNMELDSEGIAIDLLSDSGVAINDFYVFKREGLGDTAKVVSSRDNNVAIEMTEFDTVFTDRNVNTPIVIRAALENITEGKNLKVTVTCPNPASGQSWTDDNTASGKMTEELSNIVGIRCWYGNDALDSYDPTNPDDYENIYTSARTWLGTMSALYSFASVDAGHHNQSKSGKITFTLPNCQPRANGELVVYIEFTYNDKLVAAYIEQNGIRVDATGAYEDIVQFPNDISSFLFE